MTSKRNHFDVSNYLITTMHDKIVRFQQVVAAHKDTVTNEKDAMGPRLRLIPRGSTRLYSTRLDSPRLPGIAKQPESESWSEGEATFQSLEKASRAFNFGMTAQRSRKRASWTR